MPRKVWLTEIGSAQKGVLQLKGNALTYPELMAFLAKLEQDKLFTESILLKAENDSKESFTKFEITAKLGRQ
jgi:type IV pilus assembly protein PilN